MNSRLRARLRLTVIALGLVPLALLARLAANGRLMEFVQRVGARAWQRYDVDAGR